MELPPEELKNVSPITDLSRNLNTLRTISGAWVSTPELSVRSKKTETPDSAASYRLKVVTQASDTSSESEAEPSPIAWDLHRRVVLSQVNKSSMSAIQVSPLFIDRLTSRKAKKRSNLDFTKESSSMRKNSSLGYCSSTSDGFALDEVTLENDNVDKENNGASKEIISLFKSRISNVPEALVTNKTSARRTLSFAGNSFVKTPIKSKRGDEERRTSKRSRLCETKRTNLSKYHSESDIDRAAVEDLIDGGTVEILPTSGAHKRCAIPTISPETMRKILQGEFDHLATSFQIIDCRWPYEFEGGHIRGAKNLYTQESIYQEYLRNKEKSSPGKLQKGELKEILIFHCEFSSERGPRMSQYLREADRASNVYPQLFYPDVYILQGGYKDFFDLYKELCDPQEYRTMLDERFSDDCRLYRSQSKTFDKYQDVRRILSSKTQ